MQQIFQQFQKIDLQSEKECAKVEEILKQIKQSTITCTNDIQICAEMFEAALQSPHSQLFTTQIIDKNRSYLTSSKFVNDQLYFRLIIIRNEIQLKQNSPSTFDYNDRKCPQESLAKLLEQYGRFNMKSKPLQALQEFTASQRLGGDVIDYIVPLEIYCGKIVNTNKFVELIKNMDYQGYEDLLQQYQTETVQKNLYQFYCRGLLIIQKLCLDNNQLTKLPQELQNQNLKQKCAKIYCGEELIELKDIFKPVQLDKLGYLEKLCDSSKIEKIIGMM
ncbi:Hypothetical_protein [Hexamita inflata]|uniref:Hypothetical_protein n=1 Tax=Hexamita inflata TaxID=28002 RepID=A0AA86NYQ6_9EUKA|nr:Hypothetical protein HINF_LOCUS16737 [Hexamita inflata]